MAMGGQGYGMSSGRGNEDGRGDGKGRGDGPGFTEWEKCRGIGTGKADGYGSPRGDGSGSGLAPDGGEGKGEADGYEDGYESRFREICGLALASLRLSRDKLKLPDSWCKQEYALKDVGKKTNYTEDNVVCWCLTGAMWRSLLEALKLPMLALHEYLTNPSSVSYLPETFDGLTETQLAAMILTFQTVVDQICIDTAKPFLRHKDQDFSIYLGTMNDFIVQYNDDAKRTHSDITRVLNFAVVRLERSLESISSSPISSR